MRYHTPSTNNKPHNKQLWLALRFPHLSTEVSNFYADEKNQNIITLKTHAIQQLEECCYQFSPYIEKQCAHKENNYAISLELSRCLRLFHGLKALTTKLFQQLECLPYSFRFGVAHTAPAAWLLSMQNHKICDSNTRDIFLQRLQNIPVKYLQLPASIINALDKTGFETLGDIARQIKSSSVGPLHKRFGHEFSEYIKSVFDIENTLEQQSLFTRPTKQHQTQKYFSKHIQFDFPLDNIQLLQPAMEDLLKKLDHFMHKHQLQSQHIVWTLFDIYQNTEKIHVRASHGGSTQSKPSWTLFLDISLIQFEHYSLPFAVDVLQLECHKLNAIQASNEGFSFDGKKPLNNEELEITLVKIKARLGENAIYKVSYQPSHIPEDSMQRILLGTCANTHLPPEQSVALRPTWLLEKPQKIQIKSQQLTWCGPLSLIEGPERIEGYWWQQNCARDYFIAIRDDKLRLWVYHDLLDNQWYTHGIFS